MSKIILSTIILILLVIYNLYFYKNNKHVYKKELYNKIVRVKKLCYLISIITFIIFLIINLIPLGTNPTMKQLIDATINALSVTLLSVPISLETLYLRFFNNEEKYSHIKTIITNIYNEELITKFNKADINIILLSTSKTKLNQI